MIAAKKNGLNDKWARLIGIPVIVVLLVFLSDNRGISTSSKILVVSIAKYVVYVTFYWECSRFIFLYMRNRFPHLKETAKRIVVQSVVMSVFILLAGLIIGGINYAYPNGNREPFLTEYEDIIRKSLVLLGIVTVIYECAYFFGRWEHSLYESERLKKESLISQLELLKNQISPHFLFNSLNALITLVPEDPKLSVLFIQRLSNVYRHVLNYNEKNVIGLETELKFLDDYIFLNKMRFGENLHIVYQLPGNLEQLKVIPFTLQMLVENAIKHNIVSGKKPLTIIISKTGNFIVVKNNLQIKTSGVESTGTGLQNIINRYELLTNKLVEVVADTANFSVSLPLIYDSE
ncbi:MAG: signal transduction histidine kinase, LytS [Mucilaginibacter sp.]|nr:signal transduction histidine kinase, LytS [Mucilaginibacter sp.]